jgi:hypothetical protein
VVRVIVGNFTAEQIENFKRAGEIAMKNEQQRLRNVAADKRTYKSAARKFEPQLHDGAVCRDCGRTVTVDEYRKGQTNCCLRGVVPAEQYVEV